MTRKRKPKTYDSVTEMVRVISDDPSFVKEFEEQLADVRDETPTISFTVPGPPLSQPRQRHRIALGGSGKAYVQNYIPTHAPVNTYKAAVQMACSAQIGSMLDGPLSLVALFVMPRPASKTRKTKPNPSYPHVGIPDLDNLEKALLDAMQGVAFANDSQVACKFTRKIVAAGGEMPRTEVTLGPIEPPPEPAT